MSKNKVNYFQMLERAYVKKFLNLELAVYTTFILKWQTFNYVLSKFRLLLMYDCFLYEILKYFYTILYSFLNKDTMILKKIYLFKLEYE